MPTSALFSQNETCVTDDTDDTTCGKAQITIQNHTIYEFVMIPRLSRQIGGLCSAATGFEPSVISGGGHATISVPTMKAVAQTTGASPPPYNTYGSTAIDSDTNGYPTRISHVALSFVMVSKDNTEDLGSSIAGWTASGDLGANLDGHVDWDSSGTLMFTINTCTASGETKHISGDNSSVSIGEQNVGIIAHTYVRDDSPSDIAVTIQASSNTGCPHGLSEALFDDELTAARNFRVATLILSGLLVIALVVIVWHVTHEHKYLHPDHLAAHMHNQRLQQLGVHEDVRNMGGIHGAPVGETATLVHGSHAHRFHTF